MPKAAALPSLLEYLAPDDVYGLFGEEALSEGKDAVERKPLSRRGESDLPAPAVTLVNARASPASAIWKDHRCVDRYRWRTEGGTP